MCMCVYCCLGSASRLLPNNNSNSNTKGQKLKVLQAHKQAALIL
jgi:hypothetical protein